MVKPLWGNEGEASKTQYLSQEVGKSQFVLWDRVATT